MNLLDRILFKRGGHVVSDPKCAHYRALRPQTYRDRRSRGIYCTACGPSGGAR